MADRPFVVDIDLQKNELKPKRKQKQKIKQTNKTKTKILNTCIKIHEKNNLKKYS